MAFEPYLTVEQWCVSRRVSRPAYYELRKRGEAPEVLYVGRKPLITAEADRKWEEQMRERNREDRGLREAKALKYSRNPRGGR